LEFLATTEQHGLGPDRRALRAFKIGPGEFVPLQHGVTGVPLNEADLASIEAALGPRDAEATVLPGFRREFPGLSLTRCDVLYPYLVDASNRCWRLTADSARATGVVVAAKP
jgi:hypothetical protein